MVCTKNHTAILAHPAQQTVDVQNEHRQYRYQINLTNLISKMKDTIVYLLPTFEARIVRNITTK